MHQIQRCARGWDGAHDAGSHYDSTMLISTQVFAFLLTAVLLTATPGPDNLMVLSVGMSRGKRAGMAFGLGCALGCLSHTALAVVGVSALVAASPVAFLLLKITGGVYLVGLVILRAASAYGWTVWLAACLLGWAFESWWPTEAKNAHGRIKRWTLF